MAWLTLPMPVGLPSSDRTSLVSLASALNNGGALPEWQRGHFQRVAAEAAGRVLLDLYRQGWAVGLGEGSNLQVCPPEQFDVADHEKRRVREQELLQRNEQLRMPTVERFIRRMETPREYQGRLISIFDLMRDGHEFAASLRDLRAAEGSASDVRSVIDPYVQIVRPAERDQLTGLRLMDVWRYFRHTWSNQYTTVPGRTMLLLVRDRAARCHPVIGIAALSSSIVQLNERDRWIGWRSQDVLADLASRPTTAHARWLVSRLEQRRREIYVDDLVRDELFWPGLWSDPTSASEAPLRAEAKARRFAHQRLARRAHLDALNRDHPDFWIQRAESDLYRSKRCLLLADLMRDKAALAEFLYPSPSVGGLRRAVGDRDARRAIASIARRAKADAVGTEIADLTVCGGDRTVRRSDRWETHRNAGDGSDRRKRLPPQVSAVRERDRIVDRRTTHQPCLQACLHRHYIPVRDNVESVQQSSNTSGGVGRKGGRPIGAARTLKVLRHVPSLNRDSCSSSQAL